MNLSEKITVIIPTHERHQYLKRSLDFWSGINVKVLVADSSSKKYKGSIPANINYHHYPKQSFLNRIVNLIRMTETDYSTLCAVDDFITATGMEKCVEFLSKNRDYVCASGKVAIFEKKTAGSYHWRQTYLKGKSIDYDNPKDRLINHFSQYDFPTFYCVTRTDVLFDVWNKTKKWNDHNEYRFGELLPTFLKVIKGKFMLLDFFFGARETMSFSDSKIVPTIPKYFIDSSFDKHYLKFKTCIVNELEQATELNESDAGELVDKCMEAYLGGANLNYLRMRGKLERYGRLIGVYQLYSCIKNQFRKSVPTPKPVLVSTPYDDINHSDYAEWKKINDIILKYNI